MNSTGIIKIGDLVAKKSNRPFKSGFHLEVVKGFGVNWDDPRNRRCAVFEDGTVCNVDQLVKIHSSGGILHTIPSESESNFEIGYQMAKEGYGISDAWGSAFTKNPNNKPSNEDLDEWTRGWNHFHGKKTEEPENKIIAKLKNLSNLDKCWSSEDMQYALEKISDLLNKEYPLIKEDTSER